MVERISALNQKIAQYKLMLNVAEYQASLSQDVDNKLDFQTYQQGLDSDLLERRIQLQKVEEEISRLTDVMKKNKSFSDYIEMKKIYVRNPNEGAMKKLDFYYEQFRGWAETFESAGLEERKMIVCQLVREIRVSRGYELDIVLDVNYEQFLSV